MSPEERKAIEERLAAPFDPKAIRVRPGNIKGNRAMVLHYVDARVVQDRLDEVLGVTGWQDEYEILEAGSVLCRLQICIGDEWIAKEDVGGPSEQPDGGDRLKAAFSDALKRAAVKFGIGRYLYRLPQVWADYDPKSRQLGKVPALPDWALPAKQTAQVPTNGKELYRRLLAYESKLADQGICQVGELIKHIVAAGQKAGHAADLTTWSGPAIQLAVDETKAFEAARRAAKSSSQQPSPKAAPVAGSTPPRRSPPATAPAQPATAPLERPYDADQDETEVISEDQLAYLIAQGVEQGWSQQALERSVRNRWHVGLADLSVGQYREALDIICRWQGAAS